MGHSQNKCIHIGWSGGKASSVSPLMNTSVEVQWKVMSNIWALFLIEQDNIPAKNGYLGTFGLTGESHFAIWGINGDNISMCAHWLDIRTAWYRDTCMAVTAHLEWWLEMTRSRSLKGLGVARYCEKLRWESSVPHSLSLGLYSLSCALNNNATQSSFRVRVSHWFCFWTVLEQEMSLDHVNMGFIMPYLKQWDDTSWIREHAYRLHSTAKYNTN